MKHTVWLLAFFYASLAFSQTDADELSEKLLQLNTMKGEFTQVLLDEQGQTLQSSTGLFLLQRPGYFRWETLEPFPQLLVSNLKTIWLYDPDLEQVTVKPYDEQLSTTPALLLSGNVKEINRHYEVTKVNPQRYALVPKVNQELFTQLLVEVDQTGLRAMHLVDSLSQTTVFTFNKVDNNVVVDLDTFEFTPPPGSDIIDGR